jgi:ATP-dependent DNA helicase RecG
VYNQCVMELTLTTSVRFIPRVGPAMATRLNRLGIFTVEQFLYHIPFRYDDFSLISTIAGIRVGDTVTVKGTVDKFNAFFTKTGKKIQEAKVSDDTGTLTVIWFNQPYLRSIITTGSTIRLSGQIGWFGNKLVMSSPAFEILDPSDESTSLHTGRLVPIYPETEGISSKWMRGRIAFLLETLATQITEFLPDSIRSTQHFMDRSTALRDIHYPTSLQEAQEAKRRLAFEELLLLQVRAYKEKFEREQNEQSYPFIIPDHDVTALINSLPFILTTDQKNAIHDICSDFTKSYPMNRLLEGDVGSGKTIVAAIAMYIAYKNGYQSILMAPTQILAEQHHETIQTLLTPLGIRVDILTGNKKTIPKYSSSKQKPSIIIGTHALLADSVQLHNVGFVIIDEQHRFGVTQRTKLTKENTKGKIPHLLTMTATPIPRTVAKTVLGHMNLSTLTMMPKGRTPVKTWVVPNEKRKSAYAWITKQIQTTGGQVFIICPFIEESESMITVKAVMKEYTTLKQQFPAFSIGLLHGRMKPTEKTNVLTDFRNKKHEILLATPVVEVGIDIPNATVMMIEGADRFGLGQLHQLRGRVGRGSLASYCLLFTENDTKDTLERLKALERVYSGPELAEIDLHNRGAGELLGTRQHGIPNLKIASFTDPKTIEETQKALSTLTTIDPSLNSFTLLREKAQSSIIEPITQD